MERVYIDVGGCIFVSTLQTLSKSARLADMIQKHEDSENAVFVDRDPQAFSHVLNFLRTGTVFINPEDRVYIQLLIAEANYYQLRQMEHQLTKVLDEKRYGIHDLVTELKKIHEPV